MPHFTVAIIGAGPGGYETAIRLNQYNIPVVCFEKERLGGVCLNQGCIPTKSLVKVSELYHEMSTADTYGLEKSIQTPDYLKIFEYKNKVVEKLVSGVEFLFTKRAIPIQKENITRIEKTNNSFAIFAVDNLLATADYLILATGSRPKALPFLPFDRQKVLSSQDILDMQTLPKSLAIIGGGVIGCEFACIYQHLGVEVTIIEFLPELISTEDEEIAKRLSMALKRSGIKVNTRTAVESATQTEDSMTLNLSNSKQITAEKVLVSVGREPLFDIKTVGFELQTTKNFIQINDHCQTTADNVFAIGDVTGKLMLAHTASKQGLYVADYINHLQNAQPMHLSPIGYSNIPSCIFTTPEVASCGAREQSVKDQNIRIGRFPYSANGKALASGATTGFVKTITNADTDEIIGMHIIGASATELIAQASILIATKAKASDVANIIWAHPTISECIMESIEDTHKMAIHIV